jgi:hypothetical protein
MVILFQMCRKLTMRRTWFNPISFINATFWGIYHIKKLMILETPPLVWTRFVRKGAWLIYMMFWDKTCMFQAFKCYQLSNN